MAKGMDPKAVKAANAGYKKLVGLGFTQAQLARLFGVDTATTWAWKQKSIVGETVVGRANFIPELKAAKLSAADIRPDLEAEALKTTVANGKEWATTVEAREKEVAGERKTVVKAEWPAKKAVAKAAKAAKAPAKKAAPAKKPAAVAKKTSPAPESKAPAKPAAKAPAKKAKAEPAADTKADAIAAGGAADADAVDFN